MLWIFILDNLKIAFVFDVSFVDIAFLYLVLFVVSLIDIWFIWHILRVILILITTRVHPWKPRKIDGAIIAWLDVKISWGHPLLLHHYFLSQAWFTGIANISQTLSAVLGITWIHYWFFFFIGYFFGYLDFFFLLMMVWLFFLHVLDNQISFTDFNPNWIVLFIFFVIMISQFIQLTFLCLLLTHYIDNFPKNGKCLLLRHPLL